MRILIAGPENRIQERATLIGNALISLGHTCQMFFYRDMERKYGITAMNKQLKQVIGTTNPDMLIILKGEMILPETIKDFERPKVLWYFDMEVWYEILNLAKVCDYFFLHTPYEPLHEYYKKQGVNIHWLPESAVTDVYKPTKKDERYASDITFLGSFKEGRDNVLKLVDEKFNLKVVGYNWDNFPLKNIVRTGTYHNHNEETCRAIASTKINLQIGYKPFEWLDLSDRPYTVPACKGFLLHNMVPGLSELYKIDREVAVYHNYDEMIEKIGFYLKNPVKRKQIAIAGHKRCMEDHTLTKRVQQLLGMIK